ncbi:hypothetical protein ACFVGN_27285 [Streptomyces sp. NPDC057757]|uniref:hypothetical protein n=1 Tax=Streptomyces sp. NPDC057757 TaxID=3346241 RepID=UPI0036C1C719
MTDGRVSVTLTFASNRRAAAVGIEAALAMSRELPDELIGIGWSSDDVDRRLDRDRHVVNQQFVRAEHAEARLERLCKAIREHVPSHDAQRPLFAALKEPEGQ